MKRERQDREELIQYECEQNMCNQSRLLDTLEDIFKETGTQSIMEHAAALKQIKLEINVFDHEFEK